MGGQGSGRLSVTDTLLRQQKTEPRVVIATDMWLPNHSGVTKHKEFKTNALKVTDDGTFRIISHDGTNLFKIRKSDGQFFIGGGLNTDETI